MEDDSDDDLLLGSIDLDFSKNKSEVKGLFGFIKSIIEFYIKIYLKII